jgi:3-hydroxyacyl-CoA dehydrogenase/enoyl-CoA hydratase/3-hydroxybutyryl-CoA epimerase
VPKYPIKKVAVIGAGMMGAGIAYVQAMAGIETVLIDVSQESADKGKAYSSASSIRTCRAARSPRKRATKSSRASRRRPITTLIKGADLVVEAVFENPALKAEVTKKAEAQLAATAVFGSNTSTLPITGLAEASARPANFIGIHFFSPVERMGLVEIIMGERRRRRRRWPRRSTTC